MKYQLVGRDVDHNDFILAEGEGSISDMLKKVDDINRCLKSLSARSYVYVRLDTWTTKNKVALLEKFRKEWNAHGTLTNADWKLLKEANVEQSFCKMDDRFEATDASIIPEER